MRSCANKRRDFFARLINRDAGLASLRVERRGVAECAAQKRLHGFKRRIRNARGGSVVQIHAPPLGPHLPHLRTHGAYASFATRRRDAISKSTIEFLSEQFSHITQSSEVSSQA